jgi:hypothetical protein
MEQENIIPTISLEDNEIQKLFENTIIDDPMLDKPILDEPMLDKPMLDKPMLGEIPIEEIKTENNELDFDIDKEISELKIDLEQSSKEDTDKNLEPENVDNKKQLEEIADDIIKIQDRQSQKQMQIDLLVEIIKTVGFDVSNIKDISSLTFDRDFLKQKSIQDKIIAFIPELRKCYNSAYLTCLHANASQKQKNLGINVLRQLMKCNYLNMKPKVVSHGYDKASGKKLVSRIYLIEKMLY